jgi:hypothetical protein
MAPKPRVFPSRFPSIFKFSRNAKLMSFNFGSGLDNYPRKLYLLQFFWSAFSQHGPAPDPGINFIVDPDSEPDAGVESKNFTFIFC